MNLWMNRNTGCKSRAKGEYMGKNNDCVYVCLYEYAGLESIVAFDNADALLDYEDAVRSHDGVIRWSGKRYIYSGVAGYPSENSVKADESK